MARDKSEERLTNQIEMLKYFMMFFNAFVIMLGIAVFALNMWLAFDNGIGEWVRDLRIGKFYIGTYLLIFASFVIVISSILGCFAILSEQNLFLAVFIGTQILSFIAGGVGSAVILEYSSQQSAIQPLIKESMRLLISNAQHEPAKHILSVIQENIGCCGADGPADYTNLHQPLPPQCRDTVTGNPFFHGCVDELTWFFEEKTLWIAGLTMVLGMMHILNIAMSIILMKAIPMEADVYAKYRH